MSVARVTDKFGCQEDALPATRRKGALCQATINCTKSALQRQPAQKETGLDTAERRPLHQLNWRGMLAPGTLVEFWLGGGDLGILNSKNLKKKMAVVRPTSKYFGGWKSDSEVLHTTYIHACTNLRQLGLTRATLYKLLGPSWEL